MIFFSWWGLRRIQCPEPAYWCTSCLPSLYDIGGEVWIPPPLHTEKPWMEWVSERCMLKSLRGEAVMRRRRVRGFSLQGCHPWGHTPTFCSSAGSRKHLTMHFFFIFMCMYMYMYVQVHVHVWAWWVEAWAWLTYPSGRVSQSNVASLPSQPAMRDLLSLCLSRLELRAAYDACPAWMWVLGIWTLDLMLA